MLLIAPLSLLGSFGASVILSIAAAACLNYFFTPPLFSFRVDAPEDALAIAAFTTTSLIVTALTTRVRKSAEAAHASRQALIDTIPAFVWTALPDGSRDFHNRRWVEFMGVSAAEAAGEGWIGRLDPEDRAKVVEKWHSAVATGEPFEVEARFRSAMGEYRSLLVRAAPLRDETGTIVKWYGVTTDIEDRRRAAEALRASEEQLELLRTELARVSRVTTLGELTAAIAHEMKQPLAATITNAQTALRWLNAQPAGLAEAGQALGRIVKDGNRAGEVIDRIRALIKKAPPREEHLEINGAIREVIELARGEAVKNGVSVKTELAEGLPLIRGDRIQLQQVILNLILNAVEATSGIDGGARELQISSGRAGSDGVLVAVRDSGPGLDPKSADRLFESFYTTKPGGLGLGLSICRSIIEAHGGRLWASANVPRGAIFQFTVPAYSDTAS